MDQCADGNNDDSNYCMMQRFMQNRPGTDNTDFRYNWPTQIFQRVCQCNGNFGGYDCMSCTRGYTGDNCSEVAEPVVRRNILSLSDEEQQELVNIAQMIKSTTASGYVVPIKEPVTTDPSESFAEISLFDIFVSFHFNAIRDQEINNCDDTSIISNYCNETNPCPVPDFGHEGPTFLTWHRAYMLYVETELQRVTNNPRFGLPYWDWTDEDARDDIWDLMGKSDCGIFADPPDNTTSEAPIDGPFADWDAICTNPLEIICNAANQMCNPKQDLTKIQRCIGGTVGVQCRVESTLPSTIEVTESLTEAHYDNDPYGTDENNSGFRNVLEGYNYIVERDRDVCPDFVGGFRITELHNRVHIYIGGTMLDVPTASNDPIFFLHHCMIDRIYELWLDQFTDNELPSYEPSTFNYGVGPGHNIDEYLVPIFPLYTNRDMHKRATALGYTYNVPVTPSNGANNLNVLVSHSSMCTIQYITCLILLIEWTDCQFGVTGSDVVDLNLLILPPMPITANICFII